MEYTQIPGTDLQATRIALGTWAIGGWVWGGTEEVESVILRRRRRPKNL